VIAAKAGACLGLGGSGSVGAKVEAEQITQLFMFLAHQLKQADYKKIFWLMNELTFAVFNQILYLHIAGGRAIESFIGKIDVAIKNSYDRTISNIQSNAEQTIKQIEFQLKSGWGWYAYMPPESRGALISSIVSAFHQLSQTNNDLRKSAAFSIGELMATTQSTSHLDNTLDRITVEMGQTSGRDQGIKLINSVVAGTIFSNCIDQCRIQLVQAAPLLGRPFLRNDEPDFRIAQFPLHHPIYNIA
jgi:hypothetical protein